MYCHGLSPSICEVQYKFYNEEIALAEGIGVCIPKYKYEMFFSRRSILTQEYMGLDKDGNDNVVFPLDQPSDEGNTGPDSINHRYLTEDVPIGCKIYHDLGVQYGIPTPIIDSMIILAGAMHKKNFFETSKYDLAYLGIDDMSKEELLAYLNDGILNR
jgi:opine dehydrogenase